MVIIGLTGATGSGKGFFGKVVSEKYRALHIDTDKTARLVVEPGKPCLEEIKLHFGKSVINPDGSLDRKALGKIVFSDASELAVLNKLTHHYITDEVNVMLENAEKEGFEAAVIDAPLLFESGEDALCDVTVGVIADENIRKQRIIKRDSITEQMADDRIASGKNTEFFKEKCDYIIENNSDEESFKAEICKLYEKILKNSNRKVKAL